MWICTYNGLNLYLPRTESFKRFLNTSKAEDHNSVNCIFEDSYKNLWIGSDDGLRLYNESTQSFKHYRIKYKNPLSQRITSIEEANDSTLFITTYLSGLFLFNKNSSENQYISHAGINNDREIKKLHLDKNNTLWILSRINGLSYYNAQQQIYC